MSTVKEMRQELGMEDLDRVVGGELSDEMRATLVDLVISAKYAEDWDWDDVLRMTIQMTNNDPEAIDYIEFLWEEDIV